MPERARSILAVMERADDVIADAGGVVDEETVQALVEADAAMGELVRDMEAPWLGAALRELEAKAEAARVAARAQAEHARRLEARVGRVKAMLCQTLVSVMGASGRTKVGVLSIRRNGGMLPVEVDESADLSAWPEDCRRVKVEPVREHLRTRLLAGEEVPGARLGERGWRLVVAP